MEKNYVSWDKCDDEILIEKVYVDPLDRGKGIATKLLGNALNDIQHEYPGLSIKIAAYPMEKETDLNILVKFYQDMGFQVIDTEGDSVIMEC